MIRTKTLTALAAIFLALGGASLHAEAQTSDILTCGENGRPDWTVNETEICSRIKDFGVVEFAAHGLQSGMKTEKVFTEANEGNEEKQEGQAQALPPSLPSLPSVKISAACPGGSVRR